MRGRVPIACLNQSKLSQRTKVAANLQFSDLWSFEKILEGKVFVELRKAKVVAFIPNY